MGISDDIKPRRIYKYVDKNDSSSIDSFSKKHHSDYEKESISTNYEPAPDEYQNSIENKNEIEDDFFKADPKALTKKKTKHSKFPFKLLSWLLLIIFVTLFVYKNFSQIKNIILNNSNNNSTSLEKDDTYVSSGTIDNTTKSTNTTAPPTNNAPDLNPTSQINKADIKIKILNGNGIRGSADKVATTLEGSGFTISKVANAQKFTYIKTYIYYRVGAESYMELIKSSLTDRVCLTQLSDSITLGYDIVIIIGKQ